MRAMSTISEMAAIWDKALKKIERKLDDQTAFNAFFDGSYINSVENDEIVVATSTKLAASILSTPSYTNLVNAVLLEITETNYHVTFVEEKDLQKNAKSKQIKPLYFADSYINPNFTFKNFVVGTSNREAYQASVGVATNPGRFFNPVLIYGNSGLGKTHLLHAIGNAIKEKHPNLRVLYVHAQDFLNEYVKYVTSDKSGENIVDWFKSSVDVLLVDDVQFLVNKQKTEETFFSIYDNFYTSSKQVVITSDQHPSKLNGLDERLKTRFVQGLPLSIEQPDQVMCESILKQRIQSNGLSLEKFAPEVIPYFAEKFRKNIRELEGAFDRLLFYIVNIKPVKTVDLETAMDSVRSLLDVQDDRTKLSLDKIVKVVADYFNLAPNQLTGKIRTSQIAHARHIAMYLSRTVLNAPFTKIGSYFGGKDHTTVINAVNKVEKMLKTDEDLKEAINTLQSRLS